MKFQVLGVGQFPNRNSRRGVCYLTSDRWNDYNFQTQFYLTYLAPDGTEHAIGKVKIGGRGWEEEQKSPELPASFDELGDDLFSVGQDDDYYTRLNKLPDSIGRVILRALRDFAFDNTIFDQVRQEEVTRVSLLRELSVAAVKGRLNRLARGQVLLTPYSFTYLWPAADGEGEDSLSFKVTPYSKPPTNINVLIGRNGAGKTRILHGMASALAGQQGGEHVGRFLVGENEATAKDFANVVSVTFSAFDPFDPLPDGVTKRNEIKYSYVGLLRAPQHNERPSTKNADELAEEFADSLLKHCATGARSRRWTQAVETLSADPNFHDANLPQLLDDPGSDNDNIRSTRAFGVFRELSSGHSIVLLTMTKLVEKVDERTLVLLDEPESHLHPPLLSAFVRALSDLLIDRNGVAVVATHSPVVLQEVPRTCVWRIERSGNAREVFAPAVETFGENVGTLTREIFGLEVTSTGFYALLQTEARHAESYEDAAAAFDHQLGGEASAVLRAYVAQRARRQGDQV
ncbi:AAA family ATPase [Phytoactinopolyspora alkaliphila]|uniref:AAA family ATPase n=1 Tax=Phytoactinopolyspora alkaliphila TaxID=1783498 RepID=A0A6N9YP67_9ACTN|nr:AAA family ATPase [Phytoactinopolyspora alkaliphila]NED96836.1 AAA family ATPase [Phytoactinopolyspora alkaliphila]